ncbi:hypothetical protein E4625_09690 [Aeromonas hydrophila]|uniref:hypothetical protein n=1 Tax=Aeromonas hydrophila TaxID=644 RepID=UPI000FD18230|nr:hypothetical protein [Aeromonas hydrophila]AZU48387.1 hypothetical protein C3B79_2629 [Aeromonas hydrophila]QBX71083.1 hypothetical protein E4625_09690 [Aeromonas hydrophila]
MSFKRTGSNQGESFVIESIMLEQNQKGYRLEEVMIGMSIKETINGVISGEIVLNNQVDLTNVISMNGKNTLTIKMYSDSLHKDKGKLFSRRFSVYQASYISNPETNVSMLKLLFKSIGAVNNNYKRVSKSYSNAGTHVIVKDMLKLVGYDDAEINVEETMFNRDIVIPNLRPLEVIQHLEDNSVSGNSKHKGDSNFYFFESGDKVNFVSGSSLFLADPVETYGVVIDPKQTKQNVAISFIADRVFNTEAQAQSGAYGMTVISHSLVDKSITHTRVLPDGTQTKLNDVDVNQVDYNANNRIVFTSEDQMYKYLNVTANGNAIGQRELNRSRMAAQKAFMRIGCDTDITVGSVVNVIQEQTAAKWLVVEIMHSITGNTWIMDLKMIADGAGSSMANVQQKREPDSAYDKAKGNTK